MTLRRTLLIFVQCVVVSMALFFSGCSPGYVIRAAYEESKILLRRRDITDAVADIDTTETERAKLLLVAAAREYSLSIGLAPGNSFTKYSRVDRDVLAWILLASRRDAFAPFTWWFPIVGTVPYKGFFEREDAEADARKLEAKGYETAVRGTDAFSTLGWFNDPVLSTTLRRHDAEIVNTVVHESLHSTVWIKDEVAFNESLANFVGLQGAVDFFRLRLNECAPEDTSCSRLALTNFEIAERSKLRTMHLSRVLFGLYRRLEALYTGTQSSEEKIAARGAIFDEETAPLRKSFPTLEILKTINNAEILQFKIYLTDLDLFEHLFVSCGSQWAPFFERIKEIAAKRKESSEKDAFALLRDLM